MLHKPWDVLLCQGYLTGPGSSRDPAAAGQSRRGLTGAVTHMPAHRIPMDLHVFLKPRRGCIRTTP